VGLEIRQIKPEEYEEAGRVTALAWLPYLPPDPGPEWEGYLARIADIRGRADRTLVLGAFEGGRPLGTVTLEVDSRVNEDDTPLPPDTANVRMLGVAPEVQRRGIGRALMEAAMAEARARGKRVITLNTGDNMRSAIAMYAAMGFTREPDRVFPDGFRLLSYRLQLE
jgi:ribosomal protein S18 acetylase RimI-like enzyme